MTMLGIDAVLKSDGERHHYRHHGSGEDDPDAEPLARWDHRLVQDPQRPCRDGTHDLVSCQAVSVWFVFWVMAVQ